MKNIEKYLKDFLIKFLKKIDNEILWEIYETVSQDIDGEILKVIDNEIFFRGAERVFGEIFKIYYQK